MRAQRQSWWSTLEILWMLRWYMPMKCRHAVPAAFSLCLYLLSFTGNSFSAVSTPPCLCSKGTAHCSISAYVAQHGICSNSAKVSTPDLRVFMTMEDEAYTSLCSQKCHLCSVLSMAVTTMTKSSRVIPDLRAFTSGTNPGQQSLTGGHLGMETGSMCSQVSTFSASSAAQTLQHETWYIPRDFTTQRLVSEFALLGDEALLLVLIYADAYISST